MKTKGEKFILGILLLLPLLAAFVMVFFFLPERIPIHWNAAGKVNGWGSKYTFFILPGFMFVIAPIVEYLPRLSKKYARIEGPLFHLEYGLLLFLNFIFAVIAHDTFRALHNSNAPASGLRYLPLAMGLLFAFIGNILPKFKQNYFCGIRTLWTMKSEDVWFRTHRFGGRLWVVGGLLMAIAAFFVPEKNCPFFLLATMIVLGLIPVLYSWLIYRKLYIKSP